MELRSSSSAFNWSPNLLNLNRDLLGTHYIWKQITIMIDADKDGHLDRETGRGRVGGGVSVSVCVSVCLCLKLQFR